MAEQKQTENVEKPLDDNAYHVLAMMLAPLLLSHIRIQEKKRGKVESIRRILGSSHPWNRHSCRTLVGKMFFCKLHVLNDF